MVARLSERLQARLSDGGFTPLTAEPAFAALDRLLTAPGAQYGVFSVDWSRYLARFPGGRAVATEAGTPVPDAAEPVRRLRRDWPSATPDRRRELVLGYLRGMLATRLGMAETAVDEELPLAEAGLDSLVAVEVRGQIFRDLDIDLPLGGLLEGKALRLLVDELADRLVLDGPAAPAESTAAPSSAGPASPEEAERLLANLDSLTEDQLEALLPWLAEQDGTA
jgi:acyl carrier protein